MSIFTLVQVGISTVAHLLQPRTDLGCHPHRIVPSDSATEIKAEPGARRIVERQRERISPSCEPVGLRYSSNAGMPLIFTSPRDWNPCGVIVSFQSRSLDLLPRDQFYRPRNWSRLPSPYR